MASSRFAFHNHILFVDMSIRSIIVRVQCNEQRYTVHTINLSKVAKEKMSVKLHCTQNVTEFISFTCDVSFWLLSIGVSTSPSPTGLIMEAQVNGFQRPNKIAWTRTYALFYYIVLATLWHHDIMTSWNKTLFSLPLFVCIFANLLLWHIITLSKSPCSG